MEDLKKDATFKGFETWFNSFLMSAKMHLHIAFFLLGLQLSVTVFASYACYHSLWSAWAGAMWDAITGFHGSWFFSLIGYAGKLLLRSWGIFIFTFWLWLLYPVILGKMKARAKRQSADVYIAGAKLVTPAELNREISKDREKTSIKLGEVNFPESAEVKHALIVGRPGVGKTVCMSAMLDNLKKRRSRGIIYDFKGDYLSRFYGTGDIIFNPLDNRGISWNLFNEITTPMDIEAIAASLIPDASQQDPFWPQAARDVFSGVLNYLYQAKRTTNADIWQTITLPVKELAEILKHTPGAEAGYTYIQDASSKQSLSVIATMMVYTACFKYLRDSDSDFSIVRWLSEDKEDKPGFIFITNYADIQKTLTPILSLFIDLMGRKLLSMPDDYNRRAYILLDEFGTLQKLTTIKNLLTLSRSKGGSVFLGVQDTGQVLKIYGRDIMQAIVNACGTSVMFNVSDPDTADYLSRRIGDIEYSHVEEVYSMGVEDNRDGISLARRDRTKRLVLPSDISNLRDLEAYIKIPNYHVAKTRFAYKSYPNQNEPFILKKGLLLDDLYKAEAKVRKASQRLSPKEMLKAQLREGKQTDRDSGDDTGLEVEMFEN